jgi:translation initiation factor IF-3
VKPRKKINEELRDIPELLLIGQDKKMIGKKTYHEAINLARMNKLELVLVQVRLSTFFFLILSVVALFSHSSRFFFFHF